MATEPTAASWVAASAALRAPSETMVASLVVALLAAAKTEAQSAA
jgi:hypothetical protein